MSDNVTQVKRVEACPSGSTSAEPPVTLSLNTLRRARRISVTKRFGPYPFAHRQPHHGGHCRWVHGHNWMFDVTFSSASLDECGFVVDFGKLWRIKNSLAYWFDHTWLVSTDETENAVNSARQMEKDGYASLRFLPERVSPSAEGLTEFILDLVQAIADSESSWLVRGVKVTKVTVWEDSKNSATCELVL